jgi:hypothetical protein
MNMSRLRGRIAKAEDSLREARISEDASRDARLAKILAESELPPFIHMFGNDQEAAALDREIGERLFRARSGASPRADPPPGFLPHDPDPLRHTMWAIKRDPELGRLLDRLAKLVSPQTEELREWFREGREI